MLYRNEEEGIRKGECPEQANAQYWQISKKRVFLEVVYSTILYAARIWHKAIKIKQIDKDLSQLNEGCC